jgi:uncharacterized membrane protein
LVKFLHVLFAVVAVGFNISYAFWAVRARKNPENLVFTLKGIKAMDDFIANPCYVGLFLTGPFLVHLGGLSWATLWVWLSFALFAVLAVLGWGAYSPALAKQIKALEAKGKDSPEYRSLDRRNRLLGMLMGLVVTVIIFLMVNKPS